MIVVQQPVHHLEHTSIETAPVALANFSAWQQLIPASAQGRARDLVPPASLDALHRSTWYLHEEGQGIAIQRAVDVAASAHRGQLRKNGDPFITHPIETAIILAELKMDIDTIVAGLLHDTVEDTALGLSELQSMFGSSVAAIVQGDSKATKLEWSQESAAALQPSERRELNHRSMLLAMGADWRVVVVKLADRLHNMRTLQFMPRHKQVAIARETIEIFVPLARRVGIEQFEYELLSLSVDYLFPEELKGLFGLELLGHWARLQFWGVLDDFLLRDTVLSELGVQAQLSSHRHRWELHRNQWAATCAR